MIPILNRYRSDPKFKILVDYLANQIELLNYTPTEIREAAMVAQIIFEDRNLRPIKLEDLDLIRSRYNKK